MVGGTCCDLFSLFIEVSFAIAYASVAWKASALHSQWGKGGSTLNGNNESWLEMLWDMGRLRTRVGQDYWDSSTEIHFPYTQLRLVKSEGNPAKTILKLKLPSKPTQCRH